MRTLGDVLKGRHPCSSCRRRDVQTFRASWSGGRFGGQAFSGWLCSSCRNAMRGAARR